MDCTALTWEQREREARKLCLLVTGIMMVFSFFCVMAEPGPESTHQPRTLEQMLVFPYGILILLEAFIICFWLYGVVMMIREKLKRKLSTDKESDIPTRKTPTNEDAKNTEANEDLPPPYSSLDLEAGSSPPPHTPCLC